MVYTYAQNWLRERNLPSVDSACEAPREVIIYLWVMLALRPHQVPDDVKAYLAMRPAYQSGQDLVH